MSRVNCALVVRIWHKQIFSWLSFIESVHKPSHDETNKMNVHPAKPQISLGIRPVWSESSLCDQWVAKDARFLHADREYSDQTGRMPRLIWIFAGPTLILLVLSCRGSYLVEWLTDTMKPVLAVPNDRFSFLIRTHFSSTFYTAKIFVCQKWKLLSKSFFKTVAGLSTQGCVVRSTWT